MLGVEKIMQFFLPALLEINVAYLLFKSTKTPFRPSKSKRCPGVLINYSK